MKMNARYLRKMLVFALAFSFILWGLYQSESIDQYVASIKNESYVVADLEGRDTELKNKIGILAKELSKPPVDSRVDSVWKAIPGYNGIRIDEHTSLLVAKQTGEVKREHLVYEEIPIKVRLEDLGAVPIYRGNPEKPVVSLMINVAWGTEHLPEMLASLEKEKVKATFFLDGSWLVKNPDMARKILRQGHEIGNHGYSHPLMSKLSAEKVKQEIAKTEEAIHRLLGIRSALFAPPAGDYNQSTVDIAHELGLRTVLWTLDTVDWKRPAPQAIIQRIIPKVDNGMLILMHPTEPTKKALPQLIEDIKQKGLRLGTVSENFSPHRLPPVEPEL